MDVGMPSALSEIPDIDWELSLGGTEGLSGAIATLGSLLRLGFSDTIGMDSPFLTGELVTIGVSPETEGALLIDSSIEELDDISPSFVSSA